MSGAMMDFLSDLMTPDDFAASPYMWAANEAGHMALGVVFTALLLLIARNSLHAAVASLCLYACFEAAQGAWSWAFDFVDSATDWLAWVIGAGLALALWNRRAAALPFLLGAAMIGLIRGVRRREK